MSGLSGWIAHVDRTDLVLGVIIAAIVGVFFFWTRRFARKAESWPTIAAKVENVFLDVSSRGPNHQDVTHTVLAYSYSIDGSYYSGQIRLSASEVSLESVEKEMIGQQISVHYNPRKPETSIFLKHKVRGWLVVADRRTSLWSWLE
jgi:hypothetical protein